MACHAVMDICSNPNIMDMHTHGLRDDIGIELQCVLFDGEEYIEEKKILMATVAFKILNGELNLDSKEPFEITDWEDCKFKLFKTNDSEQNDILRIIECDMNGKFPEDEGCEEPFNLQYEDIYSLE